MWEAGLRWLPADDPDALRAWLVAPDHDVLAHNHAVAHRKYSVDALTQRLADLLGTSIQEAVDALPSARM